MAEIFAATVAVVGIVSAIPPSTMMDIIKILGGIALLAAVGFLFYKRFRGAHPPSSEQRFCKYLSCAATILIRRNPYFHQERTWPPKLWNAGAASTLQ